MGLRVSPTAGGVLVLIDADDDCPAHLGPALLARAREARSDVPVSVVLANREFEAWFLAAAPSLAGNCGLGHVDPPGHARVPVDIKMARAASASFDKFCREVELLLAATKPS
jgi:hypothetical protein